VLLAQAYAAAGDRSKAREAALRALRIDPKSVGGPELLRRLD
jgi:cytochrome c-type biogenesis protein CcmH/NrfG